jgi:hypothetical protein
MTYSHSGGVLSGATCYAQFQVVEGSGTVKVSVALKNPDTGSPKTATVSVNQGDTYKVSAKIDFGGRINCSPGSTPKIEVSSPSVSGTKTCSTPSDVDPLLGVTCPRLTAVEEVTLTKQ